MEPSTGDEPAGQSRGGWLSDAGAVDVSLALADPPPSMTAAHWANRDNETLYRRPGQNGTPRRPPAENSFPEDTGVIRLPRRSPAAPVDGNGYPYPAAASGSTRPGRPDGDGQPGGDERSRHWTTVGTETRRPATADRGEQTAPAPAGGPPLAMPPLTAPAMTEPPLAGPALNGAPLPGSPMNGAPLPGAADRSDPRGSAAPSGRPGPSGDPPAAGYGYGSGRPPADGPQPGRPEAAGPQSGRAQQSGRPQSGRPQQPGRPQPGGPQGGGPQGGPPIGGPPSARSRQPGPRDHSSDEIGVLGGPGRDIRPHRAGSGPGKEKPAKDSGAPRRRSRVPLVLGLMVSVVTVAGAGTAAAAVFTGKPAAVAAVLGAEESDTGDSRTVTAPLKDRTEGSLEIVTGTTQVVLRSEDLGDDLYRITTPADSDALPRPVVDGDRVQLQLTPTGDGDTGGVEVVLSSKVRWALRFAGGSDEQRVDMSQGRVASVDIAGGARRFELTLPPASGTVGVRLAGAVDEFVVTAPEASPVRVQAVSGVKTVAAGAKTLRDVKPGSTITPKDWQVENRYDIDAAGKVTLLSITNEG